MDRSPLKTTGLIFRDIAALRPAGELQKRRNRHLRAGITSKSHPALNHSLTMTRR